MATKMQANWPLCYSKMMSDFSAEISFFHAIAPRIVDFVAASKNSNALQTEKSLIGDFATKVDVGTEDLIVAYIKEHFPNDMILAEEKYNDTELTGARAWVIDPICGTTNLSRNIEAYCSNIALVENNKVIASCVVDLAQSSYYWSVQGGEVHCGEDVFVQGPVYPGKLIDVDCGSITKLSPEQKRQFGDFIYKILSIEGCVVSSINSSLSVLYTAIGKIDGVVISTAHPWDICAGAFLAQQMQREVTGLDGTAWAPDVESLVIARDKETLTLLQENLMI